MSIRLVQLVGRGVRRVGLVDEPRIRLIAGAASVYELARAQSGVAAAALDRAGGESLDYDEAYAGRSDYRLLPAMDHPFEEARCLVSGTGLTHLGSAARRDAMHAAAQDLTDSMHMFRWGVESGKPAEGSAGVSPEWFYKGDGGILRGCNQPLHVPWHAEDGGEEPEIAGVYVIADDGQPVRIGLTAGNEFSDHKFEERNYLYLASSKLRECSIGPELVLGTSFDDVRGFVKIERAGAELWRKPVQTGEANMCHSLANIEHHHFKFAQHRRPGDVHVHFFGADAFSFGDGLALEFGDIMHVEFEGFGRALRSPVAMEAKEPRLVQVRAG